MVLQGAGVQIIQKKSLMTSFTNSSQLTLYEDDMQFPITKDSLSHLGCIYQSNLDVEAHNRQTRRLLRISVDRLSKTSVITSKERMQEKTFSLAFIFRATFLLLTKEGKKKKIYLTVVALD